MDKKSALLEVKKISKVFSKDTVDEVTALDDVSLKIHPEDYITIIGSNGAGKTTLLNVIAGLFPPEQGVVSINGEDVTYLPEYVRAKYFGRVHQDPKVGTGGNLTIEENLAFALLRGKQRGLKTAINRERRELFRFALNPLGLGLENRLDALVGTLSSGQRQSIALTMATISKPSVLLLDEHVANLDPRTAQIVFDLTEMVIKREKLTTMMITHDMECALKYGNRLIMMHRGKIIVDLGKEEKQKLAINDLINLFAQAAGEKLTDEKILLSQGER
ncbi:MAG: ATP-binding cassette domain-containing protein [Thermodesulfobacteriota bacterium]